VADQKTTPDGPAPQPDGNSAPEQAATPGSPQELESLRKKAAERDQYLDLLQRTKAEFDNYQKRIQRDREQERRYQYGPFVKDLLPVFDNLQRATTAARQAGEKGPLVQGVAMVQNQFLDLLRRYGITPIDPLGKPFDPNLCEAIAQQPALGQPPNTVIQVVELGFLNHDRVLRPAKVVVSQG
jgi:molecular chaperone GrpE